MRHRRPVTLLGAALALAAACHAPSQEPSDASYPAVESGSFGSMRNVSVADQIWFGGAPCEEDLELAQRRGVRTVIDLSTPEEEGELDVEQACAELGLEYRSPEIEAADALDDAAVDQVLATLSVQDGEPTLMFCGTGSRCATLLAVYRASVVGVPLPEALIEARRAGMRPQDEAFVARQVRRLAGEPEELPPVEPTGSPAPLDDEP